MTWIIFGGLTLLTVAVLVWPLMRQRTEGDNQRAADRAVYLAQLDELERDVRDGRIS